jgi:hypothetical protein
MNKQQQRMFEGARNYAAAEKSDPFALARALTHIRTGIAGITQHGEDAFYKADAFQEERPSLGGGSHTVTVYRNMQRP